MNHGGTIGAKRLESSFLSISTIPGLGFFSKCGSTTSWYEYCAIKQRLRASPPLPGDPNFPSCRNIICAHHKRGTKRKLVTFSGRPYRYLSYLLAGAVTCRSLGRLLTHFFREGGRWWVEPDVTCQLCRRKGRHKKIILSYFIFTGDELFRREEERGLTRHQPTAGCCRSFGNQR